MIKPPMCGANCSCARILWTTTANDLWAQWMSAVYIYFAINGRVHQMQRKNARIIITTDNLHCKNHRNATTTTNVHISLFTHYFGVKERYYQHKTIRIHATRCGCGFGSGQYNPGDWVLGILTSNANNCMILRNSRFHVVVRQTSDGREIDSERMNRNVLIRTCLECMIGYVWVVRRNHYISIPNMFQ